MTRPMRARRKRILVIAAAGTVLALAAGVTAWVILRREPDQSGAVAPDRATTVAIGGQLTVEVPVGAVSAPGRITVRRAQPGEVPRGLSVGPAFEIVLSEGTRLVAPLKVVLGLPGEAAGPDVWVAQARAGGGWSAGQASVDGTPKRVSAKVSELGVLAVGWLDPGALTRPLAQLKDEVLAGGGGRGTQPECPDADQLDRQGVTVQADAAAVKWCAGFAAGRLVVRFADVSPYPLKMSYEDTAVWLGRKDQQEVTWFADRLGQLAGQDQGLPTVILRPGEQAELGIDRIWQGRTRFTMRPDPVAMLAYLLDTATQMQAMVTLDLSRFGAVDLPGDAAGPGAIAAMWDLDGACGSMLSSVAKPGGTDAAFEASLSGALECIAGEAGRKVAAIAPQHMRAVASKATEVAAGQARSMAPGAQQALKNLRDERDGQLTITYPKLASSALRSSTLLTGGSPRHILLMDVSGSMADSDGKGTIKMEGGKAAVLATLDAMPASALVGLRTYPSPQDNCGSQLQSGLTSPHDADLRRNVTALNPQGGTPTAPGLRAAVTDLENAGLTPDSSIILVSDGESNCGGDPCEVARDIASLGIGIVYTIGFNVSPAGRKELECISQATGGRYFDASDSAGLREAISTATNPALAVALDAPKPPTAGEPAVVGAAEPVTVTATVANKSVRVVDDVRVILSFPPAADNFDPGAPNPVRAIGNLQPGEERRISWRFNGAAEEGKRSRLTVVAAAVNAAPASLSADIRYARGLDLSTAGPLLTKARNVAIAGDSFSSGEGAGGYLSGKDGESCHRSGDTYAGNLFTPPPVVLACSGAGVANIVDHPQHGLAPQSTQLASLPTRPDLLLLTLGGDDVGLTQVVLHCALIPSCHDSTAYPNPTLTQKCLSAYHDAGAFEAAHPFLGKPLNQAKAAVATIKGCAEFPVAFSTLAYSRLPALSRTLPSAYRTLDAGLNGEAKGTIPIVVLAYPRLTPAYTENRGFCSGMDSAELRFLEEFGGRLNEAIAGAVRRSNADGLPVYFAADTAEALQANHTLCDRQPHLVVPKQHDLSAGRELMHLDREGYRDVTAALLRWSARPEVSSIAATRRGAPAALPQPRPRETNTIRLQQIPAREPGAVTAGEAIPVRGEGFAPGTAATLIIQSAPTGAGTTASTVDGGLDTDIPVPADLSPGKHTITAMGFDASGRPHWTFAVVTVSRPFSVMQLALWAVSVAILVAVGVLWWLWRRRRARKPGAAAASVSAVEG